MLAGFYNHEAKLQSILNHGDITSEFTKDNRIVTILQVDYLCWSEDVAAASFHDDVFRNVDAVAKALWLVGDVSEKAKNGIGALGLKVYDFSFITPGRSPEQETEKAIKGVNKEALDLFQKNRKTFFLSC